jgi:hypothetical protein
MKPTQRVIVVSALLMEISEEWETGRIYIANKDGDSA